MNIQPEPALHVFVHVCGGKYASSSDKARAHTTQTICQMSVMQAIPYILVSPAPHSTHGSMLCRVRWGIDLFIDRRAIVVADPILRELDPQPPCKCNFVCGNLAAKRRTSPLSSPEGAAQPIRCVPHEPQLTATKSRQLDALVRILRGLANIGSDKRRHHHCSTGRMRSSGLACSALGC